MNNTHRDEYVKLGLNIAYYRKLKNLSQMQLAEKTGVRQPTISAMCTGAAKHIPVDVLDKICTVLKCQPGDMIEHIPDAE